MMLDSVRSYYAMQDEVGKDERHHAILLNGKPYFQAPLDRAAGWALPLRPTKPQVRHRDHQKLGFNMIRKHVKVEPQGWYYWCDKLGILVWRDMPSGHHRRPRSDITAPRIGQAMKPNSE